MIRTLLPFDLPRCLALGVGMGIGREGARNRVYTRASLGHALPAWVALPMESVRGSSGPGSGRSLAMAWFEGMGLLSLASAAQRSGPSSWELTRLHLRDGAEDTLPELLTELGARASSRGATQLFARALAGDPVGEMLRAGGLFPAHAETLYRGLGLGPVSAVPAQVRPKREDDDYGVFRLYSACTPSEVRAVEGMTFDQWSASRPRGRGRRGRVSEYVMDDESRVVGWLRVARRGFARRWVASDITIMLHPDRSADDASALLGLGLSAVPAGRPVNVLVPKYQPTVERAVQMAGLAAEADFEVHARATAKTAKILQEVQAYNVVSS